MNHNGAPKREPFGQAAVRRGVVTEQQVHDALSLQRRLQERGEKHKLIGMILLEMGALDTTGLIDILRSLEIGAGPALQS